MRKVETASRTVAARSVGEDHAGVFTRDKVVLLVIADGSGGQRGGGAASEHAVASAADRFARSAAVVDPTVWVEWMHHLDRAIQAHPSMGETTATVCAIEDGRLVGGASVGDSEALLVTESGVVDLTNGKLRKPLLGSGRARPRAFFVRRSTGTIVLGTDGLFKYASHETIASIARRSAIDEVIAGLISAVRLPSGSLQDDIGIVVYRTT